MAFFRNDPLRLVNVQWYFVPDDRPALPYPTAFASRIYDREDEIEPSIGERYSPVPWRGGLPPRAVSDGGLCGSALAWQYGVDYPFPPFSTFPGSGIPTCCNPPVETAIGGVIASGGLFVPACCESTAIPDTLQITISVVSGSCPPLDGMAIPVHRDSLCLVDRVWTSDPFAFPGFFSSGFGCFSLRCFDGGFLGVLGDAVTVGPCGVFGTTFPARETESCNPFWTWGTIPIGGAGCTGLIRIDWTE